MDLLFLSAFVAKLGQAGKKILLGILVPRKKSVERHSVQDSGSVFPDGEQFGQCTIWDELHRCLISNIITEGHILRGMFVSNA